MVAHTQTHVIAFSTWMCCHSAELCYLAIVVPTPPGGCYSWNVWHWESLLTPRAAVMFVYFLMSLSTCKPLQLSGNPGTWQFFTWDRVALSMGKMAGACHCIPVRQVTHVTLVTAPTCMTEWIIFQCEISELYADAASISCPVSLFHRISDIGIEKRVTVRMTHSLHFVITCYSMNCFLQSLQGTSCLKCRWGYQKFWQSVFRWCCINHT